MEKTYAVMEVANLLKATNDELKTETDLTGLTDHDFYTEIAKRMFPMLEQVFKLHLEPKETINLPNGSSIELTKKEMGEFRKDPTVTAEAELYAAECEKRMHESNAKCEEWKVYAETQEQSVKVLKEGNTMLFESIKTLKEVYEKDLNFLRGIVKEVITGKGS